MRTYESLRSDFLNDFISMTEVYAILQVELPKLVKDTNSIEKVLDALKVITNLPKIDQPSMFVSWEELLLKPLLKTVSNKTGLYILGGQNG